MKHFWLALVSLAGVLALLLCGCGGNSSRPVKPVTDDFKCDATVTYRDLQLQGTITRCSDGKMTMTFSRPSSLSGVTVGWNGTNMTLELGGMSIAVSPDKVPHQALIKALMNVLAAKPTAEELTDEGYVMTGEVDGHAYTLVCDPQTGLPRMLSVPEESLSVEFAQTVRLSAEKEG